MGRRPEVYQILTKRDAESVTGIACIHRLLNPAQIHDIAQKLNTALRPDDLAVLQEILALVRELRGELQASPQAEKDAKLLINLYQSGVPKQTSARCDANGKKISLEVLTRSMS